MPATEQTWRNLTRLHVVFGATGLGLLLATLWMFAADHDRSWKDFQKTARAVDLQMSAWRDQQFQTEEYEQRTAELERQIKAVRANGLPVDLLKEFEKKANVDAEFRGLAGYDFDHVERLVPAMQQAAEQAETARQAAFTAQVNLDRLLTQREAGQEALDAAENPEEAGRLKSDLESLDKQIAEARVALAEARQLEEQAELEATAPRQAVLDELSGMVDAARHREDVLLQQRKFEAAKLDAERAALGLAVRDSRPLEEQEQQQLAINERVANVERLTIRYQQASQHRSDLQELL